MLKVLTDAKAGQEMGALEGLTVPLDELARQGAQRMIAAALDEEVEGYLARRRGQRDERGHALVVGERASSAAEGDGGFGHDRGERAACERPQAGRAVSRGRILPPYMRRSPKVTEVLPILYLRGLSTGDFAPALKLLGEDAAGLSAANVTRLVGTWEAEYEAFRKRDLAGVDYV